MTGAGLAPLPVQRPIPIWFGGTSPRAFTRMGRLADGWFPLMQPGPELRAARDTIVAAAEAAGRDPGSIKMEGRVDWRGRIDDVLRGIDAWHTVGASHVSINTMGAALTAVDDHLEVLARIADALDLGRVPLTGRDPA